MSILPPPTPGVTTPPTAKSSAETVDIRRWCREWWITFCHGSRLTRAGRVLRRNMQDDLTEYIEVGRPVGGHDA